MNVQSSRIQLLVFGFQPFVSRSIRPTSEAKLNYIVKQITDLQDMGDLQGAALELAEGKGLRPPVRWLLWVGPAPPRRGAVPTQAGHARCRPRLVGGDARRGRGPEDGRGYASGMSALSLVCNARDPHNERTDIARLVAKRADLEVRAAHGATP